MCYRAEKDLLRNALILDQSAEEKKDSEKDKRKQNQQQKTPGRDSEKVNALWEKEMIAA